MMMITRFGAMTMSSSTTGASGGTKRDRISSIVEASSQDPLGLPIEPQDKPGFINHLLTTLDLDEVAYMEGQSEADREANLAGLFKEYVGPRRTTGYESQND